jgi:hypothetical protein
MSARCISSYVYRAGRYVLGHDRFLPNPFQFIVHQSSNHSTLYSADTESAVK